MGTRNFAGKQQTERWRLESLCIGFFWALKHCRVSSQLKNLFDLRKRKPIGALQDIHLRSLVPNLDFSLAPKLSIKRPTRKTISRVFTNIKIRLLPCVLSLLCLRLSSHIHTFIRTYIVTIYYASIQPTPVLACWTGPHQARAGKKSTSSSGRA